MARTMPSSPSRQKQGQRKPRGRATRQEQMRQRLLALGALILLGLGLLVGLIWLALLWLHHHPLVVTALWVSALVLGLLTVCAFLYWTTHLPPPGQRWRHPRRADLVHYYDQRGTLQDLQKLDPVAFERYIAHLFELEGYRVETTPRSGDGGVDLLLRRPGRGRRVPGRGVALVQCKRYAAQHSVGSPELQQFSGAMRRAFAYEGYFVTTSFFTPAAQEWARDEGIHLIDGLALLHWHIRLERRARLGLISP
jgi:Restriction endonuclease